MLLINFPKATDEITNNLYSPGNNAEKSLSYEDTGIL